MPYIKILHKDNDEKNVYWPELEDNTNISLGIEFGSPNLSNVLLWEVGCFEITWW